MKNFKKTIPKAPEGAYADPKDRKLFYRDDEDYVSAIAADTLSNGFPDDNLSYDMSYGNAAMSTEYKTDTAKGLTSAEVSARVAVGKINGKQNVRTKTVGQILRGNLLTFFNAVFVVLAIVTAVCSDWESGFFSAIGNFGFMVLVVVNAMIGTIQELRAKHTIDKLSLISAPKVTVLRDGSEQEIAVRDIVLDDLTVFKAGCQICADAVVREGHIEVNESLITGEPDAIVKEAGDKVMSGSFVVSGKALAQVEHVGSDNFATKISAGAKYFKKPNSEIWRSLMLIVKVMAAIIVPLGIALFCVKYLVHSNSIYNGGSDSMKMIALTTVGSVVGMIPSGLVALASTVFCVSVVRLSRHKTLAQDLYCVETLARVDVLCLDKTGTITEGTMTVDGADPLGISENELKQIIKNLTSALPDDNATANALRAYVDNIKANAEASKIVPFSSQRKWSGARFNGVSYVLGAPEFVLARRSASINKKTDEMAQNGYRVLIIASSTNGFVGDDLPNGLKPIAFLYITDTIRKEAPDTLKFFKDEGVTVKIISGDNPATVRAVAKRAGLENCDDIVDMSTLQSEEEVREAAEKYTIFGRVLPDQKLILVNALKAAGHTVAMTGDGVNDVLALKAADCSIAMASGSDAAKNVSSLVLLDSNFASMPRVVAEGRRSINNLERSASLYLMKTLYNTLLAIMFMFVHETLPFTPQNLTLMGAVTIGIPSVVLALEPNRERVKGRFLPKVLSDALPGGITVLLCAIAVLLANEYFLPDLSALQARQLFIILITFVGFMLLFKVCLPFNLLNAILYALMLAIFVLCYVLPLPNDIAMRFFGLTNDITWEMGKAMLVIASILLPIYTGLTALVRLLRKRFGERWESKFTLLDNRMRTRDMKKRARAHA